MFCRSFEQKKKGSVNVSSHGQRCLNRTAAEMKVPHFAFSSTMRCRGSLRNLFERAGWGSKGAGPAFERHSTCPNMGVSGGKERGCRVEDGTRAEKEPPFGRRGRESFFFVRNGP